MLPGIMVMFIPVLKRSFRQLYCRTHDVQREDYVSDSEWFLLVSINVTWLQWRIHDSVTMVRYVAPFTNMV